LLLVIGIFSMFYVRERRVWIWIRPTRSDAGGAHVLMAMSAARKTLDFEKEFVRMRDAVRQTAAPADAPASSSDAVPRDSQT